MRTRYWAGAECGIRTRDLGLLPAGVCHNLLDSHVADSENDGCRAVRALLRIRSSDQVVINFPLHGVRTSPLYAETQGQLRRLRQVRIRDNSGPRISRSLRVAVRTKPSKILPAAVPVVAVPMVQMQNERFPSVLSGVGAGLAHVREAAAFQHSTAESCVYPLAVLPEHFIVRDLGEGATDPEWCQSGHSGEVTRVKTHPMYMASNQCVVASDRPEPKQPDGLTQNVCGLNGGSKIVVGPGSHDPIDAT